MTTRRTQIGKQIKRSASSARRTVSTCRDAAAVGVDVAQPEAWDDLLAALAPSKGLRVVYIRTDRRRSTDLHQRLAMTVRSSSAVPDRPSSLGSEILVKPNANGRMRITIRPFDGFLY